MLPAVRERLVSARANRLNTLGRTVAGTPGPLCRTPMTATPSGRVVTRAVTVVPGGVCVRALLNRLLTT